MKIVLNDNDTAVILIFQLFANLANRIRIKNAPKIELKSNRIRTKIEVDWLGLGSNLVRIRKKLKD